MPCMPECNSEKNEGISGQAGLDFGSWEAACLGQLRRYPSIPVIWSNRAVPFLSAVTMRRVKSKEGVAPACISVWLHQIPVPSQYYLLKICVPDAFALAQLNALPSWVAKEKAGTHQPAAKLPGRIQSQSPNRQLPVSVLSFHVAHLKKSKLLCKGVAVCEFEIRPFVFPAFSVCITPKSGCSFPALDSASENSPAEGWEYWCSAWCL